MKKKYIAFIATIVLFIGVYFMFFHKDKSLRFIPESADVVIVVDTKNLTRQYISSFFMHPYEWFKEKKSGQDKIEFRDLGLKIPDYLQVFHLKDTKFSNYYTVLEVEDFQKFCVFLKKNQFVNKGSKGYLKDNLAVYVNKKYAIVGTSDSEFTYISNFLLKETSEKPQKANRFIDGSLASLSFISGKKIQNFEIDINDDNIVIKNTSSINVFETLVSEVSQNKQLLSAELDAQNIKNGLQVFKTKYHDSLFINHLKIDLNVKEVKDTIITYEYDDEFNAIEKRSYQNVLQPVYYAKIESADPKKTWSFFKGKKWINDREMFVGLPLDSNVIVKNQSGFTVSSAKEKLKGSKQEDKNFIFLRNSSLFRLKNLTSLQRKFLSELEYVFYVNQSQYYYVKIKFKKEKNPLILR
ncbi:hypothetical protein [Chryseobacterium sp. JAH]|uniref:hypothetical protein n=1 Tax=Chryseobacterium sp. JAH TaxID=1742858 RepID=UPI000645BE1E|nr:hypothetical protein [Chryseobacterium sp. JAH]KUJ51669.1 hypothetical protein AR685_08465 [Chryseobacterium sp. JAH]